MIQYPQALPLPSVSFSVTPKGAVQRTEFESGRFRQRLIMKQNLKNLRCEFRYSESEFQTWRSFHFLDLSSGTEKFEIELDFYGVLKTHTVRLRNAIYSSTFEEDLWKVRCTLELDTRGGVV